MRGIATLPSLKYTTGFHYCSWSYSAHNKIRVTEQYCTSDLNKRAKYSNIKKLLGEKIVIYYKSRVGPAYFLAAHI